MVCLHHGIPCYNWTRKGYRTARKEGAHVSSSKTTKKISQKTLNMHPCVHIYVCISICRIQIKYKIKNLEDVYEMVNVFCLT